MRFNRYNFFPEIWKSSKGDNPILIRIETHVGHGAGTSTSKAIELYTDLWAFMFYNLSVDVNY